MGIVEVKDLCFSYDGENMAVDGVSFSVPAGSYTTIVGHNGSGKSTVAKLISGLLEKKSGDIKIDGLDLTEENLQAIRSRIGIVFQNPDNQFIGSTVRDDIAFGLENHCVAQPDMDPIIDEYAQKVKMTAYLNSEPTHLSGGQKQRVAIAGVLAMKPAVLILDEPTAGLDPQGRDEILNLISDMHTRYKNTIILVSHSMEDVANYVDRIIVMDKGRVKYDDRPKKVFAHYKELEEIGLAAPQVTYLMHEMRKQGIMVNTEATTVKEAAEEIKRLFR